MKTIFILSAKGKKRIQQKCFALTAWFAFRLFAKLQHISISVPAARVFKVHKIIIHLDNAPVFLQLRKCAGNGSAEIDQEFIGTVVNSGRPGSAIGLVAITCGKASIGAKFKSVIRVVAGFVLFVKEIAHFPGSGSWRSATIVAPIISGRIIVAGGKSDNREQEKRQEFLNDFHRSNQFV